MKISKSFNFMKLGLVTAVIGFAFSGSASATPVSTVFDVTGTFENNSSLSGTLDINTATGTITSADVSISGINGLFTLENNGGGNYNAKGFWQNVDLNDGGNTLVLGLVLPNGKDNLIGYTGGALCDDSGNCGYERFSALSSYYHSADPESESVFINCKSKSGPALVSGNVSSTPEPGATTMLGAGLSALGLMFRRRLAKK